jgi:chorismate mutase
MARKILVGVLIVLSLLLSSCYPKLSVQQYDQLKKDLAALDTERQELQTELAAIKAKNTETLAYVEFLEKLVTTQSSEKLLAGEFDAESLVNAKDELMSAAQSLEDSDINYYLGLLDRNNESQTIAAYYKVIEYCLKDMRKNLE